MAAAFVAQASRTKMLAMPVATTKRLVAERNIEALVKASLPRISPNHSAGYPNSTNSATTSLACGAGRESRFEFQMPTCPPKTERSGCGPCGNFPNPRRSLAVEFGLPPCLLSSERWWGDLLSGRRDREGLGEPLIGAQPLAVVVDVRGDHDLVG